MTSNLGKGENNHTHETKCKLEEDIGSNNRPLPPVNASQETTQEKCPIVWCYCISGKCLVSLNSSPLWPQTGPLTTQGLNSVHNRQRITADDWTEGKHTSATTVCTYVTHIRDNPEVPCSHEPATLYHRALQELIFIRRNFQKQEM